jgi:IS30 family transposase
MAARMTPWEKAKWAHDKAREARSESRRGKRDSLKLVAVRDRIVILLKEARYSPEDIANVLSKSDLGVKVCGKTIRRWILKRAPELRKHLPQRGKKRRNHLTPGKKRQKPTGAPEKINISERPGIVLRKDRVGDLEGDMIVCKQSTTAILSILDRKTRRKWYRKVANLKTETVMKALILLLLEIPPTRRHTITFDNGSEFADWKKLERLFGLSVYFCDSYSAWQKGAVENSNMLFRRFVPKGTDLSLLSDEQVARIEQLLNDKPMDCLGHLSANDVWQLEAPTMYLH